MWDFKLYWTIILAFTVNEYVSISALASFLGIPVSIASSAAAIKICATTAGIKKCNPIIKRKRKKRNQIVSLTKIKVNVVELLISKVLIDRN